MIQKLHSEDVQDAVQDNGKDYTAMSEEGRFIVTNAKTQNPELQKLLARRAQIENELPHLYGFKFFNWSREFWESTNRHTFLTCSNQSGKSIISIRKAIKLCTDVNLWKQVFPMGKPTFGFYFYPSLKLATREFETKWVPKLLPRGSMKKDPKFGWEEEYKDGEIYTIHFNIGTKIIFMSTAMRPADLQASSPDFVMIDEEMPQALWGEVSARTMATKGPISMVCTPTLGEELWRQVFESNRMPNAKIIRATMYDTIAYEDGSPGLRTVEEIEDFKAKLPTQRDIDIRVYGKFAKADGLVYPEFNPDRIVVPGLSEALSWPVYCGIDIGSGGHAHPAAISFIAVRPDFRIGRLVKFWIGNQSETTTSIDILRRYQAMKQGLTVVQTFYDYNSREFGLQAMNAGEVVMPAEKSHEAGESTLNTLFKHEMLLIEQGPHTSRLEEEFLTLRIINGRSGQNQVVPIVKRQRRLYLV